MDITWNHPNSDNIDSVSQVWSHQTVSQQNEMGGLGLGSGLGLELGSHSIYLMHGGLCIFHEVGEVFYSFNIYEQIEVKQ